MSKDMLGSAVRKLVALPSNVLGVATDLLEKMADPNWLDAAKRFLRKEQVVWYEFLRPAGEIVVSASTTRHNPKRYFQDRSGLWISGNARQLVQESTRSIEGLSEVALSVFNLAKTATNAEIRAELPENHVLKNTVEFWDTLAKMIDQQSDGAKGNLLTNGRWNIFYIQAGDETREVSVGWSAEWRMYAGPLDEFRWNEGDRVFSRNC